MKYEDLEIGKFYVTQNGGSMEVVEVTFFDEYDVYYIQDGEIDDYNCGIDEFIENYEVAKNEI